MHPLHSHGEITRDSLVRILEIMRRLAAPEAMPELLREIVEVGKVAIVAEAGVLWLRDRVADDLVMVTPAMDPPMRIRLDQGWPGRCASSREITNIRECLTDPLWAELPVEVPGLDVQSVLNVPVLGQDESLLGVMQWLGTSVGQFDEHDEWIGPALAAQAAVAIQHSYMTDELLANAVLRQEVAVAREIQMSTLPRQMPQVPGYDVHGLFLPTDHTGGDLYDLVVLEGRLFVLLGDATGHGFGPALSATQLQAMLRVSFRLGAGLDEACQQVNNQLAEDLPDDRFITAFLGFLDPDNHRLEYHSAGQGPILHFRAAEMQCDFYKPTSFPMGVMSMSEAPQGQTIEMQPGDVLGLISDGIYEYNGADGSQFGEARVAQIVRDHHHQSMDELSQALVAAAQEFGGDEPQADDITLAMVRRLPGSD